MEKEKNEIWASIGITKNLGNYESLRLDAGARVVTESLASDEDWKRLWDQIDAQLEARLSELGDK